MAGQLSGNVLDFHNGTTARAVALYDQNGNALLTLPGSVADGADVTQGAIADAAVAAGAAGSVNAHLRAISRDLVANVVLAAGSNVVGGVTVADGSNVVEGATTDAVVAA